MWTLALIAWLVFGFLFVFPEFLPQPEEFEPAFRAGLEGIDNPTRNIQQTPEKEQPTPKPPQEDKFGIIPDTTCQRLVSVSICKMRNGSIAIDRGCARRFSIVRGEEVVRISGYTDWQESSNCGWLVSRRVDVVVRRQGGTTAHHNGEIFIDYNENTKMSRLILSGYVPIESQGFYYVDAVMDGQLVVSTWFEIYN